jgi:hypothetical protein
VRNIFAGSLEILLFNSNLVPASIGWRNSYPSQRVSASRNRSHGLYWCVVIWELDPVAN